MKRLLLALILIPILSLIALLSWPELLINKKNILWLLQKKEISQELSWDTFDAEVTSRGVLKKEIRLTIKNLCGRLNKEIVDLSYCLKDADINVQIGTAQWPFVQTPQRSRIVFDFVKLNSWPKQPQKKTSQEDSPIELAKIWHETWKLPIPKFTMNILRIELPNAPPVKNLSVEVKTNKDNIKLSLLGLNIVAKKRSLKVDLNNWKPTEHITLKEVAQLEGVKIKNLGLQLQIPDEQINLKGHLEVSSLKLGLQGQLPTVIGPQLLSQSDTIHELLSQIKLNLKIEDIQKLISSIPHTLLPKELSTPLKPFGGKLESNLKFNDQKSGVRANIETVANLEHKNKNLTLNIESNPYLIWQWPLQTDQLLAELMVETKADLQLNAFKSHLNTNWKESFDQLPSPLNNFDGPVRVTYQAKAGESENEVELEFPTEVKLSHGEQKLFLKITPQILFDTSSIEVRMTDILLHFTDVRLKLPHINMAQALPQVGPDSRINLSRTQRPSRPKKKKMTKEKDQGSLDLKLKTSPDNPIKLSTNLLTSPVSLDLNLEVIDGQPKGPVNIRPLETVLFKRKILLKKAHLTFSPNDTPLLQAEVHFPLPNYLIMLNIDGPVDEPRPLLSSKPPLPEDDIISVLLFGHPLNNLPENEQAGAANRTSQILSQGLLSLSVLYFLSDTPIQSIGVDPETQKVSAQIGLDDKSSLKLSTQEDGTKSVGIRRSIGKGWFIDTSVQKSTLDDESEEKNYGVLIERIISY